MPRVNVLFQLEAVFTPRGARLLAVKAGALYHDFAAA